MGIKQPEVLRGNPILLVEDDELDAELLREALDAAGIPDPVVWVRTGEEALSYLEGGRGVPCLVLLDLSLSNFSGFDVLKRRRERPASRAVPTIVVTGSLDPGDIDRAYELGADAYIVKPRDFSSLVEILRFKVNLCLLRSTSMKTGASAPPSEKLGS